VIKEDPAEQLSPSFHAKKGFFGGVGGITGNFHAGAQGSVSLNRNSEFMQAKQKTFRERERERLNNDS